MKFCEPTKDSDVLPVTPPMKKCYRVGKECFDQRVQPWVEQLVLDSLTEGPNTRKLVVPNEGVLTQPAGARHHSRGCKKRPF